MSSIPAKLTVSINGVTMPVTDIRHIHVNYDPKKRFTLQIETINHGPFLFEAAPNETQKINAMMALKTDLISMLRLIAEGTLKVE